MDAKTQRKNIQDHVGDLISSFLYYDRKECESLKINDFERAVADGVITTQEVADIFKKQLDDSVADFVKGG